MANTLINKTVLITRPDPGGKDLCAFLTDQGIEAIHFPTIQFAPPLDEAALLAALETLPQQAWLIFISPQAVYATASKLLPLPPHVKVAAVGAGTAKALAQAGISVSLYPQDEWGSAGLLDLPAMQSVAGLNIAIIRGEGGRELLANTLIERGAKVTHVIAYRRVLPYPVPSFSERTVDAIVCTSFEAVQNLKKLMANQHWQTIQKTPLIVVSERIKLLARNLDFQTIWVARNASHAAILQALEGLNYAGR